MSRILSTLAAPGSPLPFSTAFPTFVLGSFIRLVRTFFLTIRTVAFLRLPQPKCLHWMGGGPLRRRHLKYGVGEKSCASAGDNANTAPPRVQGFLCPRSSGPQPARGKDHQPMAAPQSMQKQVLLIDDDPAIHDLVTFALRNTAQVVGCGTATEGLAALHAKPFDLLLLDLGLPDLHGLDVLARLRQAGSNTRIVIITADDTPESLLRAIRQNTYEYLRKPFTMEQIAQLAE